MLGIMTTKKKNLNLLRASWLELYHSWVSSDTQCRRQWTQRAPYNLAPTWLGPVTYPGQSTQKNEKYSQWGYPRLILRVFWTFFSLGKSSDYEKGWECFYDRNLIFLLQYSRIRRCKFLFMQNLIFCESSFFYKKICFQRPPRFMKGVERSFWISELFFLF